MTTGILPSSHRSGSRLPRIMLSGRMAPPRMAPSCMQVLEYLSGYVNPPTYNFLMHTIVPPGQGNPPYLRMGYFSFSWDPSAFLSTARSMLDSAPQANAFMWSWCGEMSWLDTSAVQGYLDMMTQLEGEYPGVKFVYMTGHTDGVAGESVLNRNNQMVRDYVLANDKVLYDFADIESWLPDGTPYPDVPTDACPWCQGWCDDSSRVLPRPCHQLRPLALAELLLEG